MRILLVHEHYQQPGGEDTVFNAEANLLADAGHDVTRLEFENATIPDHAGIISKLELAGTTVWSPAGAKRVRMIVLEHDVDVVHFHNTFPLISPAAYQACAKLGRPVVQTLHNYRLICPAATLFRDGHPCEDCIHKHLALRGIKRGCYRHSATQTAAAALMLCVHQFRGTWDHDVDRYIALTNFAKLKFIEGGIPEDLITVKPNFVGETPMLPRERNGRFLFVGRLSPEKGIDTLLESARLTGHSALDVLGDGPLMKPLEHAANDNDRLTYLGRRDPAEVRDAMASATALLFPSVWYEGFPMAIVEAFSCATPVIASRRGSMAEIIQDGVTGLHFEPGNAEDLAAKIRWAAEHPEEMRRMGENARHEYEAKYTPERNYEMLMRIYEQVIAESDGRRRSTAQPAPINA